MNMRIFNLITAGLAMLFISSGVTANADETPYEKSDCLTNRSQLSNKSPERPEGFEVEFAVENEEAPAGLIYEPRLAYVCKGDGNYGREFFRSAYRNEYMISQGYPWACYVPEGEYTVILQSEIYSEKENGETEFLTYLYVVKENVKIDGDTVITFSQNEAKNCITASGLLPDGSEMPENSQIVDRDDFFNPMGKDLWVGLGRAIVNVNGDFQIAFVNENGSHDCVYVNDLSSNWVYVANITEVNKTGIYTNCITYPGPITSDLHLQNDPSGYKQTTVKFNSDIPGVNPDTEGFGVNTKIIWNGRSLLGLESNGMICEGLGISNELPLYINAPASDLSSPTAFDILTAPVVVADKIKRIATDWDDKPILDENGEVMYYYDYRTMKGPGVYCEDNNYICCDRFVRYVEEYDAAGLLPYDELFSFVKTDNTEFFAEPPVLSIFPSSFYTFSIIESFYYPCQSSYDLPYSLSFVFNGRNMVEDAIGESFDWGMWSLDNYDEPGGVFDISLSAIWKNSDPGAIVRNNVHIDTRNEDYCPPQILRWQVHNSDGSIGSQVTSDSKIYLMCHENYDTNYELSVSIPEVKDSNLNYRLIREEQFYYFYDLPSLRQVYEVSLEDFPGEIGKQYSLEFNLSDASGNTSTQVIGNAFEWTESTGINSIAHDNNIYVVDGILHAPADAEVFTIDGRRANRNALNSGLYIVKTVDTTTKVLVR